MLKVGRSNSPSDRALSLQSGHSFYVNVEATYENKGESEHDVHKFLAPFRIMGPGVEWFEISVSQAKRVVEYVLRTSETLQTPKPKRSRARMETQTKMIVEPWGFFYS